MPGRGATATGARLVTAYHFSIPLAYGMKARPLRRRAKRGIGCRWLNGQCLLGSLAEVKALNIDVRFTPNSGHYSDIAPCPLSAKSGHAESAIDFAAPLRSRPCRLH